MNSPSVDIVTILSQSAVAIGTFNTDLFVGEEPSGEKVQDAIVTIHDTGGEGRDANVDIHHPTIMARVRGAVNGYLVAYTKSESIVTALHALHNETHGGSRYIQIFAQSDILFNGYDEKNRPIFTINFSIQRT